MTATGGTFGQAFYAGANRPSGSADLVLGVGVHNDPNDPTQFINIRLTDGSTFYTAGGALISGSASLTFTQGAPNVLSQGWPVELTDGSNVLGTAAHPLQVTGSISLASVSTVTGSITLASVGSVTVVSGSITAIQVAGAEVTALNPIPIRWAGSMAVTGTIALARAVDIATMPAVSIAGTVPVTGTVALAAAVAVGSLPAISQGPAAGLGSPWPVIIVSGSDTVGTTSHPLVITGSVFVINQSSGGTASNVIANSGSIAALQVAGTEVTALNPVPMTGTVVLGRAVDIASLPSVTVGNFPTVQTVTGSVALARAVDIASLPIVTVTGTVHMADVSAVTGSVVLARAVDIATMPSVTVGNTVTITGSVGLTMGPNVIVLTGSVAGILVGGQPVSQANPIPVQTIGGGTNVTTVSGSQTSQLIGGAIVSQANPVPVAQQGTITVTGSVHMADVSTITGSISLASVGTITGSVTLAAVAAVNVTNTPAVTLASTVINSGSVTGLLVGGQPLSSTNPLPVTGTISIANVSTVTGSVTLAAVGTVTGTVGVISLPHGNIDTGNSSTALLTASANFAGAATDVSSFASITTSVLADAAGTLLLQFSSNNSIWDITKSYPVVSGSAFSVQTEPQAQFFRVFYANGAGAQSSAFRLQTVERQLVPTAPQSGTNVGLFVGGQPLAGTNPLPVTGSITLASVGTITGSITLASVGTITGSVTLAAAGAVNITNTPNVTVISGSVAGLLVGGNVVSNANPVPVSQQGTITANDTLQSGSVTGLLYGGVTAGQTNPFWVTGSVFVINQSAGGAASNVTAVSGSVVGLQVGGNILSGQNPLPISGTIASGSVVTLMQGGAMVGNTNALAVSGTVTVVAQGVAVDTNHPLAVSGTFGSASGSQWGLMVGGVAVSNANPVPISNNAIPSGSVTGLLVGGQPVSRANPMPGSLPGNVDATNSTTALLTASANFVGTGFDVSGYASVTTTCLQDVAGTLFMQFSSDNAHWDVSLPYPTVSGTALTVQLQPYEQFFRVFYANGAGAQAALFRLQTVEKQTDPTAPISGSTVGLLVGGVAVGNTNPLPVSGSVSLLQSGKAIDTNDPFPVSGTVGFASGSQVGLMVGGVTLGNINPMPVSGTVTLVQSGKAVDTNDPFPVSGTVGSASGSQWGLMVGGTALSGQNPLPISGTIASGSVVTLMQGGAMVGNANALAISGTVAIVAQGAAIDTNHPLAVSGTVGSASGSQWGMMVGGVTVSQANPVPVRDMSGSTGMRVGGLDVSRSNLVPVAKYDVYGAAEQSGTFYSQGFKFVNVATSGTTTVLTTTNIGNRITVTSMILSYAANVSTTMFWLASTSSAGPVNLTGYALANTPRDTILPYQPNGWFQTGLCQANSTSSLLFNSNTTGSFGITLTYFITP